MPIRIIVRNNDRSVPVVFCDHCEQEITQARDGNVDWRAIDIAEPRFTHKGCSDAFRTARSYVHQSMELVSFLERLTRLSQPN